MSTASKVTMKSAFFWSAGAMDGCTFYRMALVAAALEDIGINTRVDEKMAEDDQHADIVIAQRICKPGPTKLFADLARAGKPVVAEFDDDLRTLHPTNNNLEPGYSLGAYDYFAQPDVRANMQRNIQLADLVTVTNDHLGAVVTDLGARRVAVLPNYVPELALTIEPPRPTKGVVVGWAGSASHAPDLDVIKDAVRRAITKPARFESIGFNATHYFGVMGTHRPWVHGWDSYYSSLDFSVGLAPLAEIEFNYSKSYLRCLELASRGIPVIASDFHGSPYSEFVQDGVTGFLVPNKKGAWVDAIQTLIKDPVLREAMSVAARAQAAELTIEKNIWRWKAAYEGIL